MAKNPLTHFKTFPEFSELTLADREAYEEFTSKYPPCSALCFGTLMTWWNSLAAPRVARYGDNLVISLWLPGDEKFSGLAVLGDRNVDETICAVFDLQRARGLQPRLTHVPEFVVSKIRYPDLFTLDAEREHDECLLDVKRFLSLEGYSTHQRSRIRRFMAEFNESDITVEEIDLTITSNVDLLLHLAEKWKDRGGLNLAVKHEDECMREAIVHAGELKYRGIGLFISGSLHGFLLLLDTADLDMVIIAYARFSYEFPNMFEAAVYALAKWFIDNGVTVANIESDFGLPVLRNTKLALGPTNFIRMYSVSPVQ